MRSAPDHLVLFDVDATLISTGGVGFHAMVDAGRDLFGPGFTGEGVSFAGRLDPLILRELLVGHGIEADIHSTRALRERYTLRLAGRLDQPGNRRTLPGVAALLDALDGLVTLGLLTGNFEETGSMKLRACGLEPARFAVRVWGDESPHEPPAREHLPPVAVSRHASMHARQPSRVTIIGDTPLDIACARANGMRSLGVATGQFDLTALRHAGATLALDDLTSTDALVRWLVEDSPYTPGEGRRR